jgi:NTP pyrophosphatase (non-canonical NTP hydrolase)
VNFADYQAESRKTAVYPDLDDNPVYLALGLCGEAGEVAENIKKMLRDDEGKLTHDRQERLMNELGDVLWYLAQLATELKVPLNFVAEKNIAKLKSRSERGVLHGSGSNR